VGLPGRDRLRQTGERRSYPIGGHRRSRLAGLEPVLRAWIEAAPDLTLAEMQQRLSGGALPSSWALCGTS